LPIATEVIFEIGSTNEHLHAAPPPPPSAPRLVFAELQTAGRGRRGREWLAPFGSGLTFSISWTFAETPADLSALSLAMGVCVVRALRECGAPRVQLKWPNDIIHEHAKLGGLLLQMRSEAGGPACIVAGLGLNLCMPDAARAAICNPQATPVTDLAAACGAQMPGRQRIAAVVAARMLAGLEEFAQAGYAPFAADWARFDSLRDAPVTVLRHDGIFDGLARGADREGALCVETRAGVIERVHAGDVSLRRAAHAAVRSA
jgi:BirA family biotin operon repressor/biotin-[acetyl-CoA-carboxylase] ligase